MCISVNIRQWRRKHYVIDIFAVRAFSVYFGSTPVTITDHTPLIFINRMANRNQELLT
jgi:hypothetical protein